jgi:hypothetical protein
MFTLILYFFSISIIFSFFGKIAVKLLRITAPVHAVLQLILGMFLTMMTVWSVNFFTGFSLYFKFGLFIVALLYLLMTKAKYCALKSMYLRIVKWKILNIVLFVFFVFLSLFVSASYSMFFDNESYYLQTINWVSEYGFVPGLMNLHPFLGQFSGWHILQSGVSFSIFNDINAYFLTLVLFFTFDKSFDKNNKWLSLLSLVFIFFVFFLSTPSPDLPIILLSVLSYYFFIKNYENPDVNDVKILTVLVAFSILIKLTALPNLLLLLILLWKHQSLKSLVKQTVLVLFISFGMLLAKNAIITGYVFYPFTFSKDFWQPDWQYPSEMLAYLSELGKNETYALNFDNQFVADFWNWLSQMPAMHAIMNSSFVLLLMIIPVLIKKNKALWWIYIIGLLYFVAILFYAPNFRFFLSFYIFFILIILEKIITKFSSIRYYLVSFALIAATVFSTYKYYLDFQDIFIPAPNSQYDGRIMTDQEGNLKFYYPFDENEMFWETGNAKIPALQRNQLDYFKRSYQYIPQLRKTDLKDGFYSKKLANP